MVSTRSGRTFENPHTRSLHHPRTRSSPPNIFRTLISALESSQGIKSPLLKSSYFVLIQLSSHQKFCLGKGVDHKPLVMRTSEGEARVTSRDLVRLLEILFRELQKRLHQLLSPKHGVSVTPSHKLDEVILLIRCCMVILTLPVPEELCRKNGRVLLMILKKLSLLVPGGRDANVTNFEELLSHQQVFGGEKSSDSFREVASLLCLELFDPCIPLSSAILKAVIDELLVHGWLRKYFQMIDSLSPTNERLFECGSNGGHYGMMMEMICSHFSISISNDVALHEFLNRTTWVRTRNFKASELSIMAARRLLQNPVVLSSPNLLQAHVISLVSDAISVGLGYERPTRKPKFMDCYLSVFKSSVILYTQHISSLITERHSIGGGGSLLKIYDESFQPSFESCIGPTKIQQLVHLMTKLNDSWNSSLRSMFLKTKFDLVTSATEYIQERQYILDKSCRDEVLSFLSCIVRRAANDVNGFELPLNGDTSLPEICLLASLLKLMSNSLTEAVCCIRQGSDQSCPKTLKDLPFCREYDFILGVISCFKECSTPLIQKFSYAMMGTHSMKHKESMLMLLHFVGLLSLTFNNGLDFLVKNCISTIMALTNLFILQEGNMDALRPIANCRYLPSEGCLDKEALVCRFSSVGLALKFQKIRALYVSMASVASDSTQGVDVGAENTSNGSIPVWLERVVAMKEETCSGEVYLKSILRGSGNVPDFDDLADFVECKKGKDYTAWLKDRDKYRKWKFGKRAKRQWKVKKQTWRSMKGRLRFN